MGKLITVVLAIAAISGAAYYALNHASSRSSDSGASAPKRQLDNVRGAADRIESDAEQRARDLESKMGDGQ
ncbi:hypothetical protein [Archangium lansingense]|uniref:Lipoprotein n=1 Tax=Archangium lansingense TaxID=2995310 RepID=A0ABT4AJ72_9BACT|nr:hypothetical protein [Archangium lansinium]MCY1081685.1 hypothetical protein [Archangium lansinium]